jgi:hypothetical protein
MATRTSRMMIACSIAAVLGAGAGIPSCAAADRPISSVDAGQTRELVNRPDCWSCETPDKRGCEFIRQ